jgi:beta-lactamase regulating signal transducer with metallopeptidase domain
MNFAAMLPGFETVSWALVHFVWQGAVLALLVAVVQTVLARRSAALRYVLCCAVMLAMLAAPAITFVILDRSPGSSASQAAGGEGRARTLAPEGHASLVGGALYGDVWTASVAYGHGMLSRSAPWLVTLWLAGVLALSLRLAGAWLYARDLRTRMTGPLPEEWQVRFDDICRRSRVLRPVRILRSALIQVPSVAGWLRPVLLVPASALAGLTPSQLEAILAHELAHVRRHDYLVNLLQTACEVLLFYHPAVWWVSREIRRERELCCDDVAIEVCGDRLVYARALAEIERLRDLTPRLALGADGGSLRARILRVLQREPAGGQTGSWVPGSILVAALAVTLAAGSALFTHAHPTGAGERAIASEPSRGNAVETELAPEPPAPAVREPKAEPRAAAGAPSPPSAGAHPEVAQPSTPQSDKGGSYIEQIVLLGYSGLSVDDLIKLKTSGVTPEYIRGLTAAGYKQPPVADLVRAASQGVTIDFVKALGAAGYTDLALNEVIRMRSHGVDGEYIRGMEAAGSGRMKPDAIVRARDHGVDAEFIRKVKAAGYADATLEQIIRLRDHGIGTDYIETIRNGGFDKVPLDQLVRMRDVGIDGAFLQRAKTHGFQNLTIEQLIRLRNAGVLEPSSPVRK